MCYEKVEGSGMAMVGIDGVRCHLKTENSWTMAFIAVVCREAASEYDLFCEQKIFNCGFKSRRTLLKFM
jgi:uncharacterized protein YjaG (DUF416 family)